MFPSSNSHLLHDDHMVNDDQILMGLLESKKNSATILTNSQHIRGQEAPFHVKSKSVTFSGPNVIVDNSIEKMENVKGQQLYLGREKDLTKNDVNINRSKTHGTNSRGDDRGDDIRAGKIDFISDDHHIDRLHLNFLEYKELLVETNKRLFDMDQRLSSFLSNNSISKDVEVRISQYFDQLNEGIEQVMKVLKTGFEEEKLVIENCANGFAINNSMERIDYENKINSLNDQLQQAQVRPI